MGVESSTRVYDRIMVKVTLANKESLELIHFICKKADEIFDVNNKKAKK